jgi:hypothetical protein
VIAANVTGVLTSGVTGRKVKLVDTGGIGWTITVLELVALWEGEDESVAVSVTVKDWTLVNVWTTEAPVPVEPSPKFQEREYGAVPPVVVAVNATGVFTIMLDGWTVKLVEGGGGGETVTVLELVAVFEGEDESVAVSVTV